MSTAFYKALRFIERTIHVTNVSIEGNQAEVFGKHTNVSAKSYYLQAELSSKYAE